MVGPGGATEAHDGARGADRPHWWAVLAVSLALMALVASVTSATGHARGGTTSPALPSAARKGRLRTSSGSHPLTGAVGAPASSGSEVPTAGAGSGATGSAGSPAPGGATSVGAVPLTRSATSQATIDIGGDPGGSASTSGAGYPTGVQAAGDGSAAATGSGVGPSPTRSGTGSAAATTTVEPGNLEYPDNVSAAYPVTSDAAVTATADWSGAPDLSLSISCPGRQATQSGPSGLSVSVPAEVPGSGSASGTASGAACTVTLAEPSGSEDTVSYTLAIDY